MKIFLVIRYLLILAVMPISTIVLAFDRDAKDDKASPVIEVGPNILVSRDGNFPHVEITAASSPLDANLLLAGAITATRNEGGWASRAYASSDGGNTWTTSTFPEQTENGGGDPQVAYAADGAAIFASLGTAKDENGRIRSALMVYRSENGGRDWSKPVIVGMSLDHPQMVVDLTGGKHHGRIYIGYLHGYPEYQVSVVHSDDGGRTFSKPVLAASGKGIIGINVTAMHVLSDGGLVVPFNDFDFHQRPGPRTEFTSGLSIVKSEDGGDTFSDPVKITTVTTKLKPEDPMLFSVPMLAADLSRSTYRDRMYAVWTEQLDGATRAVLSYSPDRGTTWKKGIPIDASSPIGNVQYQVQLAVNKDGVLGVTWFDTRPDKDLAHYDQYFAASVDGGATFLKSVRVSSQISNMLGSGNLQTIPSTWRHEKVIRIGFISASTRWRSAGDYMGLTTDLNGVFHPLWSDARSGTSQVWTAPIRVINKPEPTPAALSSSEITDDIDIVTDPTRYDPETHELELPLRLKNISSKRIYGPISVSVVKFGSGMGDLLTEFAPTILNSANSKSGVGADFNYTKALGDIGFLAPGALSDSVVWKLRLTSPDKLPDMHLSIFGSTVKAGN